MPNDVSQKTIAEILGIPSEQKDTFMKGFSCGMLAGSAILLSCLRGASKDEMPEIVRESLMQNLGRQIPGFEKRLTEEMINAIISFANHRSFVNCVAMR